MFGVIPLVEFLVVLGVDIDVHQKNPSAFVSHVSILSVVHGFILVPRRVCTLQDACSPGKTHTLGRPLRPSCHATRPLRITGERARLRGRLVRETARHGRLLSPSGVSLTRAAVPDGTRHLWMVVIRRDATSASWPWGDCRTPVCSTQP